MTPQLPTVLGSFAAMLVAFLSLLNGTPPESCLMKAFAAFLVFAGFGLIVRYVLTDFNSETSHDARAPSHPQQRTGASNTLDVIVPGTSVADLLASADDEDGPGNG